MILEKLNQIYKAVIYRLECDVSIFTRHLEAHQIIQHCQCVD